MFRSSKARSILLALPLVGLAVTPVAAQGPSQCVLPPESKDVPRIFVDLATGALTSGKTNFRTGKQVEVLYINANPFAYEYKDDAATQLATNDDLAKFFKAWIPLTVDGPVAAPKASTEGKAAMPATAAEMAKMKEAIPKGKLENLTFLPPPPPTCQPNDIALAWTTSGVQQGFADMAALKSTLATRVAAVTAALGPAVADSIAVNVASLKGETSCARIVAAAGTLITSLSGAERNGNRDARALEADLQALSVAMVQQQKRLDPLALALFAVNCVPSTTFEEVRKVQENLETYQAFAKTVAGDLKAADERLEQLAKQKAAIQATLQQPDRFRWTRIVNGPREPGTVTLKPARKEIGAKDFPATAFAQHEITFGGGLPRFRSAVGIAYSDLDPASYSLTKGFKLKENGELDRDSDGKPQLASVVAKDDNSDDRLGAVVLLHTRLTNGAQAWGHRTNLYFTLGVDDKILNFDSDAQFLAGFSMSLAEDRFFVTLGAFRGREQVLKKGAFEGQVLGANETEVPTTDKDAWGFGVAVSYRFQ